MVIRYPDGSSFDESQFKNKTRKSQKVSAKNKSTIHGNRGMTLESLLNSTIKYYRDHDIAIIHKKPTPVQIVNVNYPKRSAAKITEAYFRRASTTDYNGVYKGKYIDFEAKETRNKTAFPLQNFHEHQIAHMKASQRHGGVVFVIIYFSTLGKCFLLEVDYLLESWNEQLNGGRKSMSYSYIAKYGHEIQISYGPSIPFIDIIDKLL